MLRNSENKKTPTWEIGAFLNFNLKTKTYIMKEPVKFTFFISQ